MRVIDADSRQTGDLPRLLRAYLPWILLVTLVVTASAALLTSLQTQIYTSVVNVLVENRVYLSGAPAQEPDMGSEKQVATSGSVAAITATNLRAPGDVSDLRNGLSVSVPVDTNVLVISYSHPDPATARTRADAFARGYLEYLETRNRRVTKAAQDRGLTADIGLQAAEIITPASLPTAPSSPKLTVNIAVALVVGLCLGVGSVVLRDRLSDRLRGVSDFEARTSSPVLAVVPMARRPKQDDVTRLVTVVAPRSTAAHAYRALRTKVLQTAADRAAKTMVVTSSTDEEGKTALATNLAVALAQSGKDVVLVCADLQHPRLHSIFGLDNEIGLTSVVHGGTALEEAIRPTSVDRLFLLAAGPVSADSGRPATRDRFQQVLAQLRDYPDIVVVDLPPVLSTADSRVFAEFADMMLLVESLQRSTGRDLDATALELEDLRGKLIGGVLITRDRWRRQRRGRPRADRTPVPGAPPQLAKARQPWVSATEPKRT